MNALDCAPCASDAPAKQLPYRPRYARLADVADQICNADTALFRRRGLISIYGRGLYSHAAKLGRGFSSRDVDLVEAREFKGVRGVTLESQVRRYSGLIDVFRPDINERFGYDRTAAWCVALAQRGKPYNYRGLLRTMAFHVPLLARAVSLKPAEKLELPVRTIPAGNDFRGWIRDDPALYCSHLVSFADRVGGGVDPVPHLNDDLTEPNDLWRSLLYADGYLFTLFA